MLFICYSKCSTCNKAYKFLQNNNIDVIKRDIITENPTYDELKKWYKMSSLPLKKFFNTSGVVYKEMNLKETLVNMSEEEMLILLSSNGKLVKRPLLVCEENVLVGFDEKEWKEKLSHLRK